MFQPCLSPCRQCSACTLLAGPQELCLTLGMVSPTQFPSTKVSQCHIALWG